MTLPVMLEDNSGLEPPLPISNRAVKRSSANDSMLFACESRSSSSYLLKLQSPPCEGFVVCVTLKNSCYFYFNRYIVSDWFLRESLMKHFIACIFALTLTNVALAAEGDIVAASKKGDACYTPPLQRGKKDSQLNRGKPDEALTRGKEDVRLEKGKDACLLQRGKEDAQLNRGKPDKSLTRGREDSLLEKGKEDTRLARGKEDVTLARGKNDDRLERGKLDVSLNRGARDDQLSRGREEEPLKRCCWD